MLRGWIIGLMLLTAPVGAAAQSVQAQIIELIKDLREKIGMAIIWITHDLGVVAGIADHVAVMYGGRIVEYADVDSLYANPAHPYTQALLETLPTHGDGEDRLTSIPGQAPKAH